MVRGDRRERIGWNRRVEEEGGRDGQYMEG